MLIECLQTHNKGCLEEFNQQNVEEQMKATKIRDPKEIRKMQEMLRNGLKADDENENTSKLVHND